MDWYPFYPALYEADTMHLTLAEDGAYRRLIDWYMQKRRPLPDNDQALAAITRVGLDEWLAVAEKVRAFFKRRDGLLYQKRCDAELDRQDGFAKRHSEISKKGAAARWNKNNDLDAGGNAGAIPGASRDDATREGEEKKRQDRTRERSPPPCFSAEESQESNRMAAAPLAPNWAPSPEQLAYGTGLGIDLNVVKRSAVKFAVYYTIGKGALTRRQPVEWDLAWQDWIAKEGDRSPQAKPGGPMRFQG
jgi:uncharacterized protein YdaU (DUF1376 family)